MRPISPTGKRPRPLCFVGFTLLEMLVAITISSVIMVAAYGTFAAVTRTSRHVEEYNDMIQNLRFAFGSLRRDLGAAAPVPPGNDVRNKWEKNACRFTVWRGQEEQVLVWYEYRDRSLVRRVKSLGDNRSGQARHGRALPREKTVVARNVCAARFQYYAERSWRDRLRPKQWPRAMRLILKLGPDPQSGFTFAQVIGMECE